MPPDPGGILLYEGIQITVWRAVRTFLVSARKVPQRSRHRRGASSKCALSYVPHPPHHRPAFKNVPIFERLHSANLQVCAVEPAENRNIFSGRWLTRREWGPGRGGAPRSESKYVACRWQALSYFCDLHVMPRPGRFLWLLSCSGSRK